jgi:hypothetical protein
MSRGELPLENLDDRTWQDLVDQAKALIPHYTTEWTDLGPSDLGITLVELFAWLVEGMLYRLNRVPDRTYLALLNLLNITRNPPRPAATMLTFTVLSGPTPLTIAAGFKVSTTQTDQQQAITFETDDKVDLYPANLRWAVQIYPVATTPQDVSSNLIRSPLSGLLLSLKKTTKTSLYLGFDAPIGDQFDLQVRIAAPVMPAATAGNWVKFGGQYRAQAQGDGTTWKDITGFQDATNLLRRTGRIRLPKLDGWAAAKGGVVVPGLTAAPLAGQSAFWLRLDVTAEAQDVTIQLAHLLTNSVRASHLITVATENPMNTTGDPGAPNQSTGKPWQQFALKYAPVFPTPGTRLPYQYVGVTADRLKSDGTVETVPWTLVDELPPGPAPSYRLDPIKGLLLFGDHPGTTGASGVGLIPVAGSVVTVTYRAVAGGSVGNVPPASLNLPMTQLPVGQTVMVTNPGSGYGGADEESVEDTKRRSPDLFRVRNRAVTADDYVVLALSASSLVKKAAALPTPANWPLWDGKGGLQRRPGYVNVIIVPDAPATDPHPQPSAELIDEVQAYLNDRRVLTTPLIVLAPHYLAVQVTLSVRVFPGPRNDQAFLNDLKGQLLDRVRKYLHPLFGGPDGEGWDVGQSLFVSGLFAVIQPLVGDAGLIEGLSVAPDVPRSQAEQNLIKINMSASVGLPLLDYELVCSAPDEHQVINVTPLS